MVIARAGRAVVRLVPVDEPPVRRLGLLALQVDDEIFAPLPDDELDAWQ